MNRASCLRRFYSGVFYLFLPFVFLRLLWRSRHLPAYAQRWKERFGYLETQPPQNGIWVHAVSVGEFNAATVLIRELMQHFPDKPLIVTTTTPTGSQRVQTVLGDKVFHVYLPYDLPSACQRFLSAINPCVGIILETELWPNLLARCREQSIPLVLANGRLSLGSMRGYAAIKSLSREMLQSFETLLVQTQASADRFIALGALPQRVRIAGNLKFDQHISQSVHEVAEQLRLQWGKSRPVWVAASTHEGEEEVALEAHALVKAVLPDVLLIIVPRHPERTPKVISLCRKAGYQISLRSKEAPTADVEVFVGDTLGELTMLYAAADVACVGGSFRPIGGHNLLEPAALGVPSIIGPHCFNIVELVQLFVQYKALYQVKDAKELARRLLELLQESALRAQMGERSQQLVAANRGAVAAHINVLRGLLS